jgi:diaminohydroxyphosphoribosylaminopyrimidine deaminase/5-amino-6-(5-phosphoribosylamino)uracil reductase
MQPVSASKNLPDHDTDARMMAYALRMAERGLGRTWPNPSVGCVLVKNHQVIAAAHTATGGRPHAETQALASAAGAARGSTAYVTLEPCAHQGHTPPCAQALIDAGVARVVIACIDPDARVRGKGIAMLEQAGIAVTSGVMEPQAQRLHAGFFSRLQRNRPHISMKIATSLDGKIANAAGISQWITGEEARSYAHRLRMRHDAILTGIGTVLADNPALTCRLAGLETYSPVRVVVDSQLRIPIHSQLVQNARQVPLWLLTTNTNPSLHAPLQACGAKIAIIEATNGRVCLHAATAWLATQGISTLLTEGGAALNGSLWQSGLVDTLYWFRAPIALGANAADALACHVANAPSELPRLQREDVIPLGNDLLEIYTGTSHNRIP